MDLLKVENSVSRLSIVAIAGFLVFLSMILILPVFQPGYDTSKEYVSEFILGENGWLLNIAIVGNLIGCGAFTLAFYYFQKSGKSKNSLICLVCLGIATLSVLTNFFPTDVNGEAVTISGHIHNTGAFIGMLAIFTVMVLFPFQLNKTGMLRGIYYLLILLGMLAPVAFVFLLILADGDSDYVGIGQRTYVFIIMLWLIIASLRLKSAVYINK